MIARLLSWLGIDATAAWFVLVLVACAGGYLHGYGYATTQAEASHNAYVVKQSQATADAQAKHLRELRAEQERGDALSEKLLFTNAENAKLSNDLKKRVPHVSTVYIEKPGAAPVALPDRPFTAGWVRDYKMCIRDRGWAAAKSASRGASQRVANDASRPTRSVRRAAAGARMSSVPWRSSVNAAWTRS